MDELTHYPIKLQDIKKTLYQTFMDCQIRGLVNSCKWLGDLLYALDNPLNTREFHEIEDYNEKNVKQEPIVLLSNPYDCIPTHVVSVYLFAKSLFDCREYDRCAHTLAPYIKPKLMPDVLLSDTKDESTALIDFLYIYSRYMACEKRRANDEVELRRVFGQQHLQAQQRQQDSIVLGISKSTQVSVDRCSREMDSLRQEVETILKIQDTDSSKLCDAFVLYACALVYSRSSLSSVAVDHLIKAVNIYPTLWPAWYELVQLAKDKAQVSSWHLPAGPEAWMAYFFEARLALKLNEGERALDVLQRLSNSGFHASANIQTDIALAYDGLRDMDMAAKQFKQVHADHPYRLDNVDTYSNVLFVREEAAELAHLAHRCVELNKYSPETCCVVGNFFSLRGQHEKAVIYFHRALKLKPSYALVWTLVGHEFTELRNINAAVHAYRQAISHNRHDFRAWYGLGQMYEILGLPSFALYYYREAQYLVPTDSRLIVALGEIYEKLNRLEEAKKCFWRAHCVGDIEGGALVRLASCFEQCGEVAEAAAAYTEFIKLCERNGVHNQGELAGAYKYLANFHLQMGHYEDAATAANKCLEFPDTREEAKALFRQITVLAGDFELLLSDEEAEPSSSSVSVTRGSAMDMATHQTFSTANIRIDSDPMLTDPIPSLEDDNRASTVAARSEDLNSVHFAEASAGVAVVSRLATSDSQPLDLSLGCLLERLGSTDPSQAEASMPSQVVSTPACRRFPETQLVATTESQGDGLWQFTDSLLAHAPTPEPGSTAWGAGVSHESGHLLTSDSRLPFGVPGGGFATPEVSRQESQATDAQQQSMRLSDSD